MDTDLTIKQAAEALGVHPRTVRRYIKQGRVHWTLIRGQFGEEYRISRDSLGRVYRGLSPTVQPLADSSGLNTFDIVNRLENQARLIEALRLEIAGLRDSLQQLLPPAPPEVVEAADAENEAEQAPIPPAPSPRKPSWWARLERMLLQGGKTV